MDNVFWLIPDRLAGRPGPGEAPWSLAELSSIGFRAVIDLTESEPARAEFERYQIEVGWYPIPNDFPANEETERICRKAIPEAHEYLLSQLDAGHKVLVHCAWGRDRTGLLLAYHAAVNMGDSPSLAIARVRRVRAKALTADGWEEMTERIIADDQKKLNKLDAGNG